MNRGEFIKSILGAAGLSMVPKALQTHYDKVYLLQCFVRGFQYYHGPKLIKQMNKTGLVELVREPKNKYDKEAIAIHYNNKKIGFVPRESNEVLSKLLDAQLIELQAEITHIEPQASTWENVHIAIHALKEIKADESIDIKNLAVLETPNYLTLKNGKDKYVRIKYPKKKANNKINWRAKNMKEHNFQTVEVSTNYFDKMVEQSDDDSIYSVMMNSFESEEEMQAAFEENRVLISKRNIEIRNISNNLFHNIDNQMDEVDGQIKEMFNQIEQTFGDKGFVMANTDKVCAVPNKIEKIVERLDQSGMKYYQLILKA